MKKDDPIRKAFEYVILGIEGVLVGAIDAGQIESVKRTRKKSSCTISPVNSDVEGGVVRKFEYYISCLEDPKYKERRLTVSGPWNKKGDLEVGLVSQEGNSVSENEVHGIFKRLNFIDLLVRNHLVYYCNGEEKREECLYLIPTPPKKVA